MKTLLVVSVLVVGVVWWYSASLTTACVVALFAAPAAGVVKRVVCRDGRSLEYDDNHISFMDSDGSTWGPYNRT